MGEWKGKVCCYWTACIRWDGGAEEDYGLSLGCSRLCLQAWSYGKTCGNDIRGCTMPCARLYRGKCRFGYTIVVTAHKGVAI